MSLNPPYTGSDPDHEILSALLKEAQAGRHAQAIVLACSALEHGLEHPLVLNLVALGLEQEGRAPEAVNLLQRAVQLAPQDIGSRNALGLCLLRLQQPREALEQFEAILELDSPPAYAHANRGTVLRALGTFREAEASYRRALDIDPGHGLALAGVATLAAQRGAYRQARFWAEKALAVIPGFPEAALSLATADLGERQLPRAEATARALLQGARLSALERAHAHGLLGDILDAADRSEEAFAAYTSCNQELQQLYAGRFASSFDYVRGLTAWFERGHEQTWSTRRPAGPNRGGASAHVFLIGFPRSGTTLLNNILAGHPAVVSLEEQELLIDAVREFMPRPHLEHLSSASSTVLARFRAAYWDRVAAADVSVQGKVFVDSHALNSLKLPLIARLFPDAKILFACRDPRDTVLSCFRNRLILSAPGYELLTLAGAARYYDAVMQLLLRLTSLLPLDICLVRHEDVVTEFTREMKRICEFLRLEWHPAMGDFALRDRDVAVPMPSASQLLHGLGTEGLGQWHRYRPYLEPVLVTLEPWVKRFYYEPPGSRLRSAPADRAG
jgi:tetratricopeptide (TPR) repeat protein